MRRIVVLLLIGLGLLASGAFAAEPVSSRAGKFTVEVTTHPSPPTVGEALLIFTVKQGDQPLSGAGVDVHVDMTSMPMPADVKAVPGRNPGEYGATVNFSMAGEWKVDVRVQQMAGMAMDGDGMASFLVETGKGIHAAKRGGTLPWMPVGAVVLLLVAALVYRFREKLPRRLPPNSRGVVVGILTLALVLAGTVLVVRKYRDPKQATVVGSAFMNMSAQAAPGTVGVTTEVAQAGSFRATASYTGTVVPDIEEDVFPRVTGRLLELPFYPGDTVGAGQMVARLDAAELAAKQQQAAYGAAGAQQDAAAAHADASASRATISKAQRGRDQAQAQLAQAESAVRAAESSVSAAQAGVDQANEAVTQAEGDVESAEADVKYWDVEVGRSEKLYKQGAIAREELDRETAQATTARAKLKQAQAGVRTAEAGVARAEQELARAGADRDSANSRVEEARAARMGAEADVSAAQASADSAAARAGAAVASAGQARAQLTEASTVKGYTEIRSAFGGVVTARPVSPGVLVQPGTPILKIAKIDVVRLQATVSEADLGNIAVGSPVTAHTVDNPTHPVTGKVTAIFPARDPASRTSIVEARITNPGMTLKPGQYLSMEIATGAARQVLSVPNTALLARDGVTSVFTVSRDGLRNTAHRVTVATGQVSNDRTEILDGLKAGDEVVTAGQANLKDGDAVTVLNTPAAPVTEGAAPASGGGTVPPECRAMKEPGAPSATIPTVKTPQPSAATAAQAPKKLYTCPMASHADVISDHPGKCPKCGMDLVEKQ